MLEIGTGTGSLTALLAERAGAVVSVEIDARMHQLASEELFGFDNVVLLQLDALRNKNTSRRRTCWRPSRSDWQRRPGARFKVAANLPYNVATPILTNLLECPTPPVSMTVTIQKELAERITASPGTKDYGALSIWIQCQCRASWCGSCRRRVFWPRPKVTSAILHIERDEERRRAIRDPRFFHQFVRSLFLHRRKFLRSVLVASYKETLGKAGVDAILAELGLPAGGRAEELDVPTVLALSDAVQKYDAAQRAG